MHSHSPDQHTDDTTQDSHNNTRKQPTIASLLIRPAARDSILLVQFLSRERSRRRSGRSFFCTFGTALSFLGVGDERAWAAQRVFVREAFGVETI
jgi:hypothetical protein